MPKRKQKEGEAMFKTGELVKICRAQAGLTQVELATRAHTTAGYIGEVEKCKVVPRVDWLETVLNVCGYELGIREKL